MKIVRRVTFLATCGVLGIAASGVHAALTAHWPLDDGGGSTATDVQNGLDGTLEGGAALTTGDIARGNVLELDGVDGAVDLTDHVAEFNTLGSGTITGWYLYDDTDAIGAILTVSNSNVGSTEGRLFVENGRLRWDLRDGDGDPDGEGGMMLSQEGVDDGQWRHFAVTVDGVNQVSKLYLDGVLVGHGDGNSPFPRGYEPFWGAATDASSNLDTMSIGRNTDSGGPQWYFGGRLSDIAVYDEALSEGQVRDVMQNGVSASPADLGPLPMRTDGVVAHYLFNEQAPGSDAPASSTLVDQTGNHDGTILSETLRYVAGAEGSALRFGGDDFAGHRVEVAKDDDFYVLPGEGFTVETIFKTRSEGTRGLVSMNGNGGETWMRLQDGEVRWFLNDSGGVGSLDVQSSAAEGEVANTGAWTHVAGVYDPDSEQVLLYINHELVDTEAAPASFAAPLNGDGNPLVIGDFVDSTSRRFVGDMDQVRISRGALNPQGFLPAPIPEPATVCLGLLGAGLALTRRRSAGRSAIYAS